MLPGQAAGPAGGREAHDLPGLRLRVATVGRRLAAAALGGFLLFAGHPPLDWAWAGYLALVPLLWLARDVGRGGPRRVRTGFGWGLIAGIVFFLPLLVWISRFGVAPWVLLAILEGVAVAAFLAVTAAWGERPGRPVVAVAAWVAFEWLRSGVPLGGFPWGLLGYAQHDGGLLLPLARAFGVLGVSAALAGVAAVVEELVARRAWRAPRVALGPVAVLVVAVALGLGVAAPRPAPTGATVDIAGVQGNTVELPPFVDRANVARVEDVAGLMVTATQALADAPDGSPDVVVWPENALDADPRTYPVLAERLAEAQAAIGDATLLAGTLLDGPRPGTFRNAIVRYTAEGDVADVYDKRVLVPFGEYVPWRRLLGDLPPLRAIPSDAVPGSDAKTFTVGEAVIGPITCYESIFPGLVRDQVRAGANVLVVSTNNASFGRTPASRQHLAFSQVRAVETGRWILHSGISGLSAVVAPDSSLSQETELFERAIVREDLPLVEGLTLYLRFGDVVGPAAALALTLLGLRELLRRRRAGDTP